MCRNCTRAQFSGCGSPSGPDFAPDVVAGAFRQALLSFPRGVGELKMAKAHPPRGVGRPATAALKTMAKVPAAAQTKGSASARFFAEKRPDARIGPRPNPVTAVMR